MTQGDVWGGYAPLRSWSFFENVVSNEAIWCTIFHHIKHLTACLLRCFFYFRTGWSKSGEAMPPVRKVEGPLAPLAPGSAAYGLRRNSDFGVFYGGHKTPDFGVFAYSTQNLRFWSIKYYYWYFLNYAEPLNLEFLRWVQNLRFWSVCV